MGNFGFSEEAGEWEVKKIGKERDEEEEEGGGVR